MVFFLQNYVTLIMVCTPCLKKNDNDVANYNFNAH